MNYKYVHFTDINEWRTGVNSFLRKNGIASEPIKSSEDLTITYSGKGMILAVWDLADKDGWIITDSYYKNKGIVEQIWRI